MNLTEVIALGVRFQMRALTIWLKEAPLLAPSKAIELEPISLIDRGWAWACLHLARKAIPRRCLMPLDKEDLDRGLGRGFAQD
jgi:hypothetical protein